MRQLVTIQPCLEFMFQIGQNSSPQRMIHTMYMLYESVKGRVHQCFTLNHMSSSIVNEPDQMLAQAARDLKTLASKVENDVNWNSITFFGELSSIGTPLSELVVTIGWLKSESNKFGISIRLVCLIETSLTDLKIIARKCITETDDSLCWAQLTHRFITPLLYSRQYPQAYQDIYYLSKRYSTVDIGDELGLFLSLWRDAIRTIGWWNYVGLKFVSQLNQDLGSHSDPLSDLEIKFTKSGGLILDIDCEPTNGDINRQASLPKGLYSAYRLLERFIPAEGVDFLRPWDSEESIHWLHRWRDISYYG